MKERREALESPMDALRAEVDSVALACLHGLPGWRLATTEDPAEAALIAALTTRAMRFAKERDGTLATEIINRLAEAINRGR